MLADTVKDWILQSKNDFDIACIESSLYQIRNVNTNKYKIFMEADAALSIQIHDTYATWPDYKKLIVLGMEDYKSDLPKIQKVIDSANNTYLHKKNITAEAVSYNGYHFVLLRNI